MYINKPISVSQNLGYKQESTKFVSGRVLDDDNNGFIGFFLDLSKEGARTR